MSTHPQHFVTTGAEQQVHVHTTAKNKQLTEALQQWANLLGSENVRNDPATIEQFSRTTLPKGTRPAAVIWPGSTEEVSEAVKIAAKYQIPVYPVSCGKNWGYGDMCAPTDGQVIMHLGRMNRILEVNPELAYAVIEPGVTQGQLYNSLQENNFPLILDVTGAGPDASIVGNTLERGFGHTPYGNHFLHMCGLEVVLADGSVLQTGFGAFENARARWVFPWGIGPWIDGLFTQSNFGIVTKMGIWLMPKPEVCQAFAFKTNDESKIGEIVEALRELRLRDIVRSTVHIGNDLRLVSARTSYPWHLTGGKKPLPQEVRIRLRRQFGIGAWNVMGALYGTRQMVRAMRVEVKRVLRRFGRVWFFGAPLLSWARIPAQLLHRTGIWKGLPETLEAARSVYDLLIGKPSAEHLAGVGWRSNKTNNKPADPLETGSLWLAPVLPATKEDVQTVLSTAYEVFSYFAFDPLVTLTSLDSRCVVAVMTICFDKYDPGESQQAAMCYSQLWEKLATRGYLPYRMNSMSMDKLLRGSSTFWALIERLGQTLDPLQVIAPGRYRPFQLEKRTHTSD